MRKHGVRRKLHDKSFQLLALLLFCPGEIVTREEIQEKLWSSDTFVDFENGINSAANRLREALGDSAQKPKFVETVPRRGYRFIAPVEIISTESSTSEARLANGLILESNDLPQSGDSANDGDLPAESPAVVVERPANASWFQSISNRKRLVLLPISVAFAAVVAFVLPSRLTLYVHRPHPARAAAKAFAINFVYVLDYSRSEVRAYSVDQSSRILIPADIGPFKSGEHPYAAAMSPGGDFLYVANRGRADGACGEGCSISAYAVDQHNGALTELDGSPYPAGSGPVSLAVHPSGKYLYVVNVKSNDLLVYVRLPNGDLKPVGKPQPVGRQPFFVAATPSGRFVYVSNQDDATISGFAVADDGALKATPGSPFATGLRPRSITIDPESRFAYIVNYGVNPFANRSDSCVGTFEGIRGRGCTISVFKIDPATGALSHIGGSPFESDGINPLASVMDASGKYLIVTNINSNNVSVYERDKETGAIHPVSGSPFQADKGPVSGVLDSSDIYLYVVNAYSHNVSEFEIEDDGRLRLLRKPIAAGSGPEGSVAQRWQHY